ncbi:MAG: OmpA family protein [Ignavibacteriae bacterium]|nr:OmpA family protein [Ignavibacteriota bacterium]
MKRLFLACAASLLLIVGTGNRTTAQIPLRLGFTTGVNFANQSFSPELFSSDNPQAYRTGFVLGGIAEFGISGIWSLQAELEYIQKGTKFQQIVTTSTSPTPLGTTDATFKLDYFELPLLLKARLENDNVQPFFIAGPALCFNNLARIDAPGTHVLDRPNTSTLDISGNVHSVDLALDIGAGLEYRVSSNSALLFDVRYSHGLSDIYNNPSIPSAKSYGISLMAGLLFNITRSEEVVAEKPPVEPAKQVIIDTDGDGLPDDDEINIYKTNPYQADSDGDGLKDGEEILTYKTNPLNGDTDDDGLNDGAEVKKYKTDPLDPDTDHGGIKDGPEVFRGTNPLDPSDDLPRKEEFKIDVGKAIVLAGVVFKTGSAEIGPASAAILEKAYNTLEQNPDILVGIHGHTDNVGKRAYNMKLSMARANAVKDYLVQRGIDEKRISTKGFGFDKPIASNDTPEGRQKNRRIEFFRTR